MLIITCSSDMKQIDTDQSKVPKESSTSKENFSSVENFLKRTRINVLQSINLRKIEVSCFKLHKLKPRPV